MLRDNNGEEYIPPIGAPFHSDIASERDKKPKYDDDDWNYIPIGAPYHSDIYSERDEKPIGAPFHDDD